MGESVGENFKLLAGGRKGWIQNNPLPRFMKEMPLQGRF